MFEGSLVESRGMVGTGTERWTALGSVTVQCAVAGLLIAIPLLRPQVMTAPKIEAPLALPFLHKPPVPVEVRAVAASAAAMSLPAAGPAAAAAAGPTVWPHPGEVADGDAPGIETNVGMDGPGSLLVLGIGSSGPGPTAAVVRARPPGLVNVSTGVSEGMLLAPIRPVYPAIARAVRMQGTVVMEAVISKAGRVESLHAVSGPEMLRSAALQAVAEARYRPYLLNGQPTEVKTTITVVFSLGS
jgi:protein TonB